MLTVEEAYRLARRAHGGDRTRSGGLFIDHVRRVAKRMEGDPDENAMVAAWLRDTVEKGSKSWEDLWQAGADRRLIEVVDALTERDGESDESYLARAAANSLALRIKRADIADKLDPIHSDGLSNGSVAALLARSRQRLELLEQFATDFDEDATHGDAETVDEQSMIDGGSRRVMTYGLDRFPQGPGCKHPEQRRPF
jgi:hypothetical protein